MKTLAMLKAELPRIIDFIRTYVMEGEKVIVPVSGGLDSDVVARLCVSALGRERVRLFAVRQQNMEQKYLDNVNRLAADLDVPLAVVPLGDLNVRLIQMLEESDPEVGFHSDGLLDPARANCSLRTAIFSSYQDKGYLVAANSNLSEIELGFFMPFGDNLGHFKPISHLYKSEVRILAGLVGSRPEVIAQSPSAGFWKDETDLEDIAYWLYNGGPVSGSRTFTEKDDVEVEKIKNLLSQEQIDACLEQFHGSDDLDPISQKTGLPLEIVEALYKTVQASAKFKRRPLLVGLERAECCTKN